MNFFEHEGFRLAYVDEGEGEPVLLIHGFASSHSINWVTPGWVRTLTEAGYRAIALDNRGHGASSKSYDKADYAPALMAGDAAALLEHLGISRAHVMGYSMGARISAFLALSRPDIVATLVFGGLGSGMTDGVPGGEEIIEALLADNAEAGATRQARMFRTFADQTRSDRKALAACMATSRQTLSPADLARIELPTLVAVGSRDDVGGTPEPLAAMMPNAEAFVIEGRDHMLAVGDRTFKKRVLSFYAENPIH